MIVIELHKLDDIFSDLELFDAKARRAFEALKKSFTVIHAHPNNCCGTSQSLFGSGMRIPRTLEVTMVRTDAITELKSNSIRFPPELPHALDIATNVPDAPPIFLGKGWRSSKPGWGTVLRMVRIQIRYEALWRWKKLIPPRAYRAYRKYFS